MTSRLLFHTLFALLLVIAGPVSASHAEMSTPEPHCEEMGASMQMPHNGGHDHMSGSSSEPQQDCDTQCFCCPGTCSGTVALSTASALLPFVTVSYFAADLSRTPHRTPAELLRPPTFA